MGRIVVSTNTTLDGVVQDPTGEEGYPFGGWMGRITDRGREALAQVLLDDALAAGALLFGRRTYEMFAARWPTRPGALADRLNALPKYVVSSTLADPQWANSTVLDADPVLELTRRVDGDLVVYGSILLAHELLEQNLVDELRLTVFPAVAGAGTRLFTDAAPARALHLVDTRRIGTDLARLTYHLTEST